MKKLFILIILVLSTAPTFSGCAFQKNTPSRQTINDKEVSIQVPLSSNQTSPSNPVETKPPHLFGDFKGANQSFSGGGAVQGYNLAVIRRVPHPSFYRMVFEFALGEEGLQGAPAVPAYQITMNNDQTQIIMDLPGVNWANVIKEKEAVINAAPLLKDIHFQAKAQGGGQILLSLQQKAVFQVFDLPNPSRVVIVMNPIN